MMDSKFNECQPANPGTGSLSSDKQQPKKNPLKDLPNDNRINIPKPLVDPPMKDREPVKEASTISGIKRPATELPQSTRCNHSAINGTNGHIVYARRKSDQEQLPNCNNCEKDKDLACAQGDYQEKGTPQQQVESESTKKLCFQASTPVPVTSPLKMPEGKSPFLAKPVNGLPSVEQLNGTQTYGVRHPGSSQGTNDQRWKERFTLLQTHLRNCERDRSRHQEYIKMLQGLSPVDRSKHAVELEKRAIQLLLEEGHELMRMKHLNVLGKSTPMNTLTPLTKHVQTEK